MWDPQQMLGQRSPAACDVLGSDTFAEIASSSCVALTALCQRWPGPLSGSSWMARRGGDAKSTVRHVRLGRHRKVQGPLGGFLAKSRHLVRRLDSLDMP